MNQDAKLRFTVSDYINNVAVSPAHVSLALLGEFQKDVSDFLRGSTREVDPAKVVISLEAGSLALVVSGLLSANGLWQDIQRLNRAGSLSGIDTKRAAVVERWQINAMKNTQRRYLILEPEGRIAIEVNATSGFARNDDQWVYVEKYLHGKVVDLGGKSQANVHLELTDGSVVIVAATQNLLMQGEKNRLYRPALLRVKAEENILTGPLRNVELLGFETHQPSYDDGEFSRMVDSGTAAWANTPVGSAWLDDVRGGRA